MQLTCYGYADQWQTLDNQPVLAADKDLVNYQWDDNLHEWWVNRSDGLEQGYGSSLFLTAVIVVLYHHPYTQEKPKGVKNHV